MRSSPTSPIALPPKPARIVTTRVGIKVGTTPSATRAVASNAARLRPTASTRSTSKTKHTPTVVRSSPATSPKSKSIRASTKVQAATASSKAKAVAVTSPKAKAIPASSPARALASQRGSIAQSSPKLSKVRVSTASPPKPKPASRKLPASPSKAQVPARATSSAARSPRAVRSVGKTTGSQSAPTVTRARSTTTATAATAPKTAPHRASALLRAKTEPARAAGGGNTVASPPATPTVPSKAARPSRSVGWAV